MSAYITVDEAIQLLELIKTHAKDGDYEAAHGSEDTLRERCLETIRRLSEIAVCSSHVDFARHCA